LLGFNTTEEVVNNSKGSIYLFFILFYFILFGKKKEVLEWLLPVLLLGGVFVARQEQCVQNKQKERELGTRGKPK
jgi:hypothetical protein